MSNIANDLPAFAEQRLEGVVIGTTGWSDYGSEDIPGYKDQTKGKVLTWADARPMLDYEYDEGFGGVKCNAIYAWTKDRVIWITQYDGATGFDWMPRNPTDVMPDMPGG